MQTQGSTQQKPLGNTACLINVLDSNHLLYNWMLLICKHKPEAIGLHLDDKPIIILLIIQERYQYMYLTQPSLKWDHFKLSQLCHVDMRLLFFNCLYEARNPSLYQSLAVIACGNTHRNPPLLHLGGTSMSAFDCLSLGYFLSCVCHTASGETSVHLDDINDKLTKFLVKGLTEGIREAKSCRGGSVGSLSIKLNYNTWEHDGMHYLTQLLQSSEGNCISGLTLFDSHLTHPHFLCLAEAVGTSTSLRVLKLLLTALTKESRLALGKMLQRNTTLKTFCFTDYQIPITDIAEGVKYNSILETVQFEGFISSIKLAEMIRYNKQLKTLSVSGSLEGSTVYLIEALKRNSTLQHFGLHGVILTVPQLELLANALTINTTLEKLEYESESVSKVELPALTERLWVSGVLHQLLTIALERTIKWFGEQETIRALETILLEWNSSCIFMYRYR